MNQVNDERLVIEIKNGHKQACGVLYERYKKVLFAFFYNYSGDVQRSEDLVQQTFEKILKSIDHFSGKGSFKSWMFTIARNIHIDQFRKNKKLEFYAMDDASTSNHSENPFEGNEKEERMNLLSKAIKLLDADKRELLIMTKIKGMKYKDVAQAYDVPEGTIKVRMCRIMKELKETTLEMAKNY